MDMFCISLAVNTNTDEKGFKIRPIYDDIDTIFWLFSGWKQRLKVFLQKQKKKVPLIMASEVMIGFPYLAIMFQIQPI